MRKIDFILYFISLILGGAGGWIISRWGGRLSLMDHPNERSSHKIVTPKGGGVGILLAFLFCSLYTKISCWIWFPALSISLLGLLSDRFEISPQIRLIIQFISGIITIIGIERLNVNEINEILLIVFFTFYIVGTANYYNFMDGIDGIAGITGIVGFGLMAFYTFSSGSDRYLVTLPITISIACLGFLPFNIPKARVFMGDVGSILLGFVFAVMVVYLSKSFLDFVCLVGFLFPFYADELTTMMIRIKDGDKLSHPHRRHLYQLLANECEIPHWKVSLGYGLFQLLIGISILLLRNMGWIIVISALVFYFCSFMMLSIMFRKKNIESSLRSNPYKYY
jgi:UDP-N-acetylmuramyl pentapeptide phosphotransferase/UDP-N-acetylglucosamine-1-phosphate transferase